MNYLTRSIDQYVYMRKRKPKRFDFIRRFLAFLLCVPGRRMGFYLLILFFVTKLLFIVNSLGQLFLLNIFLGHNFASYGVELMKKILNGEELAESIYFPRVTMCEFAVRNIQNVHVHTVQVSRRTMTRDDRWTSLSGGKTTNPHGCSSSSSLVRPTDKSLQWKSLSLHLVLAGVSDCLQYVRSARVVRSFLRSRTLFVHQEASRINAKWHTSTTNAGQRVHSSLLAARRRTHSKTSSL